MDHLGLNPVGLSFTLACANALFDGVQLCYKSQGLGSYTMTQCFAEASLIIGNPCSAKKLQKMLPLTRH